MIFSPIQPRMCGDYCTLCNSSSAHSDTTPRVRGLRPSGLAAGDAVRYNPACAGTTNRENHWTLPMPIQPRVCGDYAIPAEKVARIADTTPRVRGLLHVVIHVSHRLRYNPACAGTTNCIPPLRGNYTIQPRVCGDYRTSLEYRATHSDTTPRVRGLHQRISGTRAILS